jgi:hypothetical protein
MTCLMRSGSASRCSCPPIRRGAAGGPITGLGCPDQHGDCPRFIPLMEAIRIGRRGRDGTGTRPGAGMGDKAYSCAANRAYLRKRGIKAVIPIKEDQKAHRRHRSQASGRPPSTPDATRSAIPLNAALASSISSALLPPTATSGNASSRAASTSPRSGSGYEIQSHDSLTLPDAAMWVEGRLPPRSPSRRRAPAAELSAAARRAR